MHTIVHNCNKLSSACVFSNIMDSSWTHVPVLGVLQHTPAMPSLQGIKSYRNSVHTSAHYKHNAAYGVLT